MVTYYTDDNLQMDKLTYLMDLKGIAYTVEIKAKLYPFKLLVDGVPLDYDRAYKWIMER